MDHFGRRLLDICANLNLTILNGAIGSDKGRGKFTFVKSLANGSRQRSVIDYFICSYILIPYIIEFNVLKIVDGTFDHRPLITYFSINNSLESMVEQFPHASNRLFWKNSASDTYTANLIIVASLPRLISIFII